MTQNPSARLLVKTLEKANQGDSVRNLAQLHKVAGELGTTPSAVLRRADAIEKQLRTQGVEVLPEKPDNAAAALVGLGLLAALLLPGGR